MMVRQEGKVYRTITGGHTDNVCGMCFAKIHRGALTVEHVKKHKCLARQCDAFVKFDDHPYWAQRADKRLRCKNLV
jgi:hypothetical protein